MRPFHLAIPVIDLEKTRIFYTQILGCSVGRESDRWIDFNFKGHQVTGHLVSDLSEQTVTNQVDEQSIPVRHFGLILVWNEWHELSERLKEKSVEFIIEPTLRFKGKPGEQATMFIKDPNGNALEFKAFKDDSKIFEI